MGAEASPERVASPKAASPKEASATPKKKGGVAKGFTKEGGIAKGFAKEGNIAKGFAKGFVKGVRKIKGLRSELPGQQQLFPGAW